MTSFMHNSKNLIIMEYDQASVGLEFDREKDMGGVAFSAHVLFVKVGSMKTI